MEYKVRAVDRLMASRCGDRVGIRMSAEEVEELIEQIAKMLEAVYIAGRKHPKRLFEPIVRFGLEE